MGQPRTKVSAVDRGTFFDKSAEHLRGLEDARIVSKQAKQQAYQQHLQRVAGVALLLEHIVQPAHALCRLDVHRVLRLYGLHLVARHKPEQLDVFVQVLQRKLNGFTRSQLVHAKAGEVAHDDDLWQIAFGNAGKVRQRLRKREVQVFAAGLVLDQQHARPEQIHETVEFGFIADQFPDGVLESGNAFIGDAEDFKEIDPERLRLAVFIGRVGPGAAEGQRAGFDFVPA